MNRDSTWTCPRCLGKFPYNQPVIIDGCAGHETPIHDCGPGWVAMRLRPKSKTAVAFWNGVKDWVRSHD